MKTIIIKLDGVLEKALEERKQRTGSSYTWIIKTALTEYLKERGDL